MQDTFFPQKLGSRTCAREARLRRRIKYYLTSFVLLTSLYLHWKRVRYEFVHKRRETLDSTINKTKYLVPYIKGQGLNNQLWEFRDFAIIAKATNRILCLEPFHRFYLQKEGKEFIPFRDIFDIEKLKNYVQIETEVDFCSSECGGVIDSLLEFSLLPKKVNMQKPFPIADWRPGSLSKFKRSTGFKYVPRPMILSADKHRLGSLMEIGKSLSNYSSMRCTAVAGTIPVIREEYLKWSRSLEVAQNIKDAVKEIQKTVFEDRHYLAIHWRFEESKCAGIGKGIGFGRSGNKRLSLHNKIVRKSDEHADLCFFAGPVQNSSGTSRLWFRLVSKKSVVDWLHTIMHEHQLDRLYIATDCHDEKILSWVKSKTGAKSKSDILSILSKYVSLDDNDIISRVEQQLCTESKLFAGTLASSWTSSVIEERLKSQDNFFMQDKYNPIRRPDIRNQTFYLDIEVCKCELK